ncbi:MULTISPECIES: hypothetical protein [unclassified Tolypothrix]|nr:MULTISPECIES: hypothetical protein [unclassified Tolypothrix]MBE9084012.1 hypothetical protein [Tolypothrix sp. LEGE 11397]UYD30516.1 hypothetical protein HGR01_37420 [Tolypothrix sp. PCC 7712]UYD38351.1 hypothetical protein HG267_38295 [Tolypothrix sp. PCC 7601]
MGICTFIAIALYSYMCDRHIQEVATECDRFAKIPNYELRITNYRFT